MVGETEQGTAAQEGIGLSGSLEKRFRRKCSTRTAAGCIEWRGWCNNSGYGMIKSSSKPYVHLLAHRVAYELHHGRIENGLDVMHSCDNKRCVNVEHLSVGSHQENMADMVEKGRQRRSSLSETDVERIKDMYRSGALQKQIASQFGVSRPLVSMILTGRMTRFSAL